MLLRSLPVLGLGIFANALSFSDNVCLTKYGPSSVSQVPSTTSTLSKGYTVTIKSTSTKTSTVVPSTVSSTTTVYTTTTVYQTLQKTDTFSTTTTSYSTYVSTITASTSTTSTSTYTSTSQDTTTMPTSYGFVPLQSYISSVGFRPAKRDVFAEDEEPVLVPRQPNPAAASPSSTVQYQMGRDAKGSPTFSPPIYPTQVRCTAFIEVISVSTSTLTASKTATITAKTPTQTITTTSTISTTSTVNAADASTTITSTYTSVISTSTTSTSTSTSVITTSTQVIGPGATVYAACADPANYLHTVNEAPLMGFENSHGVSFDASVIDPQACCNLCQSQGGACGTSFLAYPYGCYLLKTPSGVCNATQVISDVTADHMGTYNDTASNGDCGTYTFNGLDLH